MTEDDLLDIAAAATGVATRDFGCVRFEEDGAMLGDSHAQILFEFLSSLPSTRCSSTLKAEPTRRTRYLESPPGKFWLIARSTRSKRSSQRRQ